MTQPCLVIIVCSLALSATAQNLPQPITFPADGGIVSVADFGAVPDDDGDDTEAIQKALDAYPDGNRIVYLPAGIFLVSDTLRWSGAENAANAQKRTILQGAGQFLTTIRLRDGVSAFNQSEPKAVIWTGSRPAQRFRNAVRDLTIETGAKNGSAIGLQFNASNQGCVRNVTIRSMDGGGKIGLDLGHTDEIGPLLVKSLTVEGFNIGISTKWPVNSITFEHVALRNQRQLGWWNYHQMIFVRGLVSVNRVTALYNERNSWGTVTMLDAYLHGAKPDRNTPAILNQRHMYLRDIVFSGYNKGIENDDKKRDKGDVVGSTPIEEDTSHRNVSALFRKIDDATLRTAGEVEHLPIKETPIVPWDAPGKSWANIVKFGADPTGEADASPALQRAIDSGARSVYLPGGAVFKFDGPVEIRGPVRRIVGFEGRFVTGENASWTVVDGRHPGELADAPTVVIERMENSSSETALPIRHRSGRTLVVNSTMGLDVTGQGKGDIFLEDHAGHLELSQAGQSAWCRQLNSGRTGTKCINRGGKLWILGMKTEKRGTVIETTNGGITDAAGIFVYSNSGWDDGVPAFLIQDATATLCGINERNFNRQPVSLWVRETRSGETREQIERPFLYLSGN